MKVADPMPLLRTNAEDRINAHYAATRPNPAHARKRELAEAQWRLQRDDTVTSAAFGEAADIEGVTPLQLAELILSKPDEQLDHDNARRRLIVAARRAATPAEIDAILQTLEG